MKLPRFSVLTLLTGTALVAVSVALMMERNRSRLLLIKNQKLAEEIGHFETSDPARTYVRHFVEHAENSWRFRIQLPVDTEYNLGIGTIGIREDGKPDFSLMTRNQGNFLTNEVTLEGQFNIQITMAKRAQTWCVTYVQHGQSSKQVKTILFDENQINKIFGKQINSSVNTRLWQNNKVADYSSDEPIVLFRSHHAEKETKFRDTQLEEAFIVALMPVVKSKTIDNKNKQTP